MILFHSPLTLVLLLTAVILAIMGSFMKKGQVLPFFGAVFCALAALTALLQGASWQEALMYVLLTLAAASLRQKTEGGRGGEL